MMPIHRPFGRPRLILGLVASAGLLLGVASVKIQPLDAQTGGATGEIRGTVTADRGEVRGFRVRARDIRHRITYTVFTNQGRYQIFDLPASEYEVSVVEDAFDSPVLRVDVGRAQTAVANVVLTAKPPSTSGVTAQLMDYDQLYPPGPGRVILERNCFGCHGPQGWHNRGGKTEEEWRLGFARMWDQEAYTKAGPIEGIGGAPALEHQLSESDKEAVVKYLATHFPKGHSPRNWKLDTLIRDEEGLSRAIWIQYEYPAVTTELSDYRATRFTHDAFPSTTEPGVIWVSGYGTSSAIAVNTRDLNFETRTREYRIPQSQNRNFRPHGIIEHKGLVYSVGLAEDMLGILNPKTGEYQQYQAPSRGGGGHTLRADSKGNIWFTTVYGKSRINRFDAATKKVTEYNPVPGANWYGIVTDAQDRMWAVGYGSFFGVIMYDPKTDKWTTYRTSATNRRLTIDPSGNVWTNQYFGNAIAKVEPATGKVTEYKLPLKYGNPYEGWSDLQGNIWVENAVYNSLVKFEPRTNKWTYVPFPEPRSHAPKLEVDAEGTLWDAGFGPRPGQLRALKPNGNVPARSVSTR